MSKKLIEELGFDTLDLLEKLKEYKEKDLLVTKIILPNPDGVTFNDIEVEFSQYASIPIFMVER